MGINFNGANGSVSGKVGSVVFVNTKRGTVVRSLPAIKKNRKPTENQIKARKRFKLIQKALSHVNPIIRKGFAQYDSTKRAYDSAMSYNLRHAVQEGEHDYEISWDKFTFAKGLPNPITSYDISIDEVNRAIQLDWMYDKSIVKKHNLLGYTCHILLLETDTQQIQTIVTNEVSVPLYYKTQHLPLPQLNGSTQYHVYLFFFADNSSNKSTDSMYLGEITV